MKKSGWDGSTGAAGGKSGVHVRASAGGEGRCAVVTASCFSEKKFASVDLEAMSASIVVVRIIRLP